MHRGVYLDRPTLIFLDDVDVNEDSARLMFPNDARLRDATYGSHIYVNVHVLFKVDGIEIGEKKFSKHRIGILPIMLHSEACVLNGQSPTTLKEMGECPYDQGGYFIIDGKEKVIVARERQVINRLFIDKMVGRDEAIFDMQVPLNMQKPAEDGIEYKGRVRSMDRFLQNQFPRALYFNVYGSRSGPLPKRETIEIESDYIRLSGRRFPVPLFVLFRALGIESDRDIMALIYDDDPANLDDSKSTLSNKDIILRSCAKAAASLGIFDQLSAAEFLAPYTNYKSLQRVKQLLVEDIFPNAGPDLLDKARYLAFIVRKLINVATGTQRPTNRDSYEHKRIDVTGEKLSDLFRDRYLAFVQEAKKRLNAEFRFGSWRKHSSQRSEPGVEVTLLQGEVQKAQSSSLDVMNIVNRSNLARIFSEDPLKKGVINSFKGDWNNDPSIKKESKEKWEREDGVVQELNRLSYHMYVSHVRRVTSDLEMAKYQPPHFLYATQMGSVCPVESPDGINIGITKHLAMMCHISRQVSPEPLIDHMLQTGLFVKDTASNAIAKGLQSSRNTASAALIINDILEGVLIQPPALVERYLLACAGTGSSTLLPASSSRRSGENSTFSLTLGAAVDPFTSWTIVTLLKPPATWLKQVGSGLDLTGRKKKKKVRWIK